MLQSLLAWLVAPLATPGGIPLSPGDIAGFSTGLACVALAARGHIANFPVGIINSLILGLVFLQTRLFGDASLQVLFVVLGITGWMQWHRETGESRTIRPWRTGEAVLGLAAVPVLALGLRALLQKAGGAAPWPDAFITSASLWAQWLLNGRRISTWAWWIAVDIVSIPLYWSRGLPLLAGLYIVFLALCVQGWMRWRHEAAATA